MMHGWGMGVFGLGFPLLGVISLTLLGGGIFVLVRKLGTCNGSRRRNLPNREAHGMPGGAGASAPEVFRLAKHYDGVLTVSEVVSELSVDPEEAEEILQGLTDGRRVDMQVDDNGVARYVFRELTA